MQNDNTRRGCVRGVYLSPTVGSFESRLYDRLIRVEIIKRQNTAHVLNFLHNSFRNGALVRQGWTRSDQKISAPAGTIKPCRKPQHLVLLLSRASGHTLVVTSALLAREDDPWERKWAASPGLEVSKSQTTTKNQFPSTIKRGHSHDIPRIRKEEITHLELLIQLWPDVPSRR